MDDQDGDDVARRTNKRSKERRETFQRAMRRAEKSKRAECD
jgi:hypothetical protein